MGMLSGPKAQGVNQAPPAAHAPQMGSAQVLLTGLEARQRARSEQGEGSDNTVFTSPSGAMAPKSQSPATLLGG